MIDKTWKEYHHQLKTGSYVLHWLLNEKGQLNNFPRGLLKYNLIRFDLDLVVWWIYYNALCWICVGHLMLWYYSLYVLLCWRITTTFSTHLMKVSHSVQCRTSTFSFTWFHFHTLSTQPLDHRTPLNIKSYVWKWKKYIFYKPHWMNKACKFAITEAKNSALQRLLLYFPFKKEWRQTGEGRPSARWPSP